MSTLELVASLFGGGVGGAGAKAGFDYLRARVRVNTTADLTLNERLWARIAKLEERADQERDECDAKLEAMRREVAALRATCDRQEDELTDLRNDKEALARDAKRLADEVAKLTAGSAA